MPLVPVTSRSVMHVALTRTRPHLLKPLVLHALIALLVRGRMRLEPLQTPLVFHVESTALHARQLPPALHARLDIMAFAANSNV